jgi:hypothetical protein
VRPWPAPPTERTVHVIGDVHVGLISRSRLNLVLDDLRDPLVPRPELHLQIGDITHHGRHAEDAVARRWLRALPAPSRTIMGNHDILHNHRSPAQWAKAYGNPGHNFAIDLGFVRILAVAPDRDRHREHSGVLSATTLAWLDRQLAAADTDCWIASHWPLHGTVLGDPRRMYTSLQAPFYAKPDAEIRRILARRPKATAWICGHTHSPLDAPHLVRRLEVGGRGIACVNASAIAWVGRPGHWTDPVETVYVTHVAGGIRVRFRDHGAGVWTSASHERLVTVAVGRH